MKINYLSQNSAGFTEGESGSTTALLNVEDNVLNGKLKILIAEDDKVSATLISLIVKELAQQVIIVQTGAEAVATCRIHPDIDLLLIDIAMPVMDGYEAIRQIRQFNKNLIIITQTSFAQKGDMENALMAGCNGYLEKPFKQEQLINIIKKQFIG